MWLRFLGCEIRLETPNAPSVVYIQEGSQSSVSSSASSSSSSTISSHDATESSKSNNLESIPESQVWSSRDNPRCMAPLEDTNQMSQTFYHALLHNPEARKSKKVIFMPRTSSSDDSVNTNTTGYISETEQAV